MIFPHIRTSRCRFRLGWKVEVDVIAEDMRQRILSKLRDIEADEAVRIVFACESGSRAWGFASQDSDYDVRFIYVHAKPWYLSVNVEDKRDVIERPIVDDLDVNGWDLRKALQLFRKSNPPLMEWLGSPIVYLERSTAAAQMRALGPSFYSTTAAAYHYLHMAQGNFREFLKGPTVKLKKYLYVLRPLLAIRWIEAGRGVVPTEFPVLLAQTVEPGPVRAAIATLVKQKAEGAELDQGPRIDAISDYIEAELARLEATPFANTPRLASVGPLDQIFQTVLDEIDEEPEKGGGAA